MGHPQAQGMYVYMPAYMRIRAAGLHAKLRWGSHVFLLLEFVVRTQLVGAPPTQDVPLSVTTAMTLAQLRRTLEERHGPFTDLQASLDAEPGHPGCTPLLDTDTAGNEDDDHRTLAAWGVWGRRHKTSAEAEEDSHPVVRFLYVSFKPGPSDPLLLFDGGP